MRTCAIISFRLGGIDGVSRVVERWQEILTNLDIKTYTIAGEGDVDYLMPGLAIQAKQPPDQLELQQHLEPADFVLVENLCTIPLNLPASKIVAEVLRGRPAIMHHHDPPWQREHFKNVDDLPIDDPSWKHITINQLTVKQMAERGIRATCIYNPFETNVDMGNRQKTREILDVAEDELLIAHPARALPIKNISGALEITQKLGGTYWIMGPAEKSQDYSVELNELIGSAQCRAFWKSLESIGSNSIADVYAAADLIVFPSHWESFGMPPIEAAIYGRHVVVGNYPVAKELMDLGFLWFNESDLDSKAGELKDLLKNTESNTKYNKILETNKDVAIRNFSIPVIQKQVQELISSLGV